MIKSWIKLFLRISKKEKQFLFIKILGLSLTFSSCFLILVWLNNEYSYDKIHSKNSQLYRIISKDMQTGEKSVFSPSILGKVVKESIPGVKYASTYLKEAYMPLNNNLNHIECSPLRVDEDFFNMFSYELSEGDLNKTFSETNSIILSQNIAKQLFPTQSPLGQVIKSTFGREFTITGILSEDKCDSHMSFDVIFPMDIFSKKESWLTNYYVTYVSLNGKETSKKDVENEINQIASEHSYVNKEFYLQEVSKAYLNSEFDESGFFKQGNRKLNMVFILALGLLVFITSVNYINLTILSGVRRNTELGMRHILGSNKKNTFFQFAFEALLTLLTATLVAVLIILLLLPIIKSVFPDSILLESIKTDFAFLGLSMFVIGVLTSIYPAWYFGSHEPIRILQGKLNANMPFRKMFLGFQVIISFIIFLFAINVNRQITYIKEHDLGIDIDNIIEVNLNSYYRTGAIKERLMRISGIDGVTVSTSSPNYFLNKTQILNPKANGLNNEALTFVVNCIDDNFIDVFDLTLTKGSNFSKIDESSLIQTNNFIINESGAKALGYSNPIGKKFRFNKYSEGTIIGLVEDFNFKPLQHHIQPLILAQNTEAYFKLYIKVNPNVLKQIIPKIQAVYYDVMGEGDNFEYSFLSDTYKEQYSNEFTMANSFSYFALICVVICLIGLYSISSFILKAKERGVAVRKVFGADDKMIVRDFLKDFSKIVIIALLFSIPIALYMSESWLNNYVYRINIDYWQVLFYTIAFILVIVSVLVHKALYLSKVEPSKILQND